MAKKIKAVYVIKNNDTYYMSSDIINISPNIDLSDEEVVEYEDTIMCQDGDENLATFASESEAINFLKNNVNINILKYYKWELTKLIKIIDE